MEISPHWLFVFSVTYHNAVELLFLVFAALSARLCRGTRWQVHLRWLIPFVVNDALIMFDRILLDACELGIVRQTPVEYALSDTVGYLAAGFGAYGMYRLWQTLRAIVPRPSEAVSTSLVHEQDVWPPPPTSVV